MSKVTKLQPPPLTTKTLTLRLTPLTASRVRRYAHEEARSVNNWLTVLINKEIVKRLGTKRSVETREPQGAQTQGDQ